jgi:Rps23 Pro-64 3,4-dihydroxylase Tpa1-like proline 4-hydroxylase
MWRVPWSSEQAAAAAWRAARPFPHLVADEVVAAAALPELSALLEEEAVERYLGEIFAFEASAPEPATAELRELRAEFAATLAPPLSRITGKPVTWVDMRAYAYRPGHYLLPHTDHQDGLARVLAYAYYLPSPEPPVGGELELFACELAGAEITAVASATVIEPRGNRLVVFDVGDATLHQVREVLGGLRMSLAGWFYA